MKKLFTIFAITCLFSVSSCKKDVEPKPAVADIPFYLYDVKTTSDTSTIYINHENTFMLKGDYTWTMDLAGAKSSGTYTWVSSGNYQAQVKFTILQWTTLNSDTAISNKLKYVIESVDNCGFPGATLYGLNFLDRSNTSILRTHKK